MLLPSPARAVTWDDVWARPDQQAARALEDGDPAHAAAVARNPLWKGAALYRDQQYEEAVDELAASDETLAHYNRGNALARAGQLREALAAYDAALEKNPQHEDALYNRALVARLMEQLRQQSRQREKGDSGGQGQQGGDDRAQGSADQDRGDARDQNDQPSREREDAAAREQDGSETGEQPAPSEPPPLSAEEQQAMAQWLRRIPDDPGGLLRRKFQLEYSRRRPERPQGTDAW